MTIAITDADISKLVDLRSKDNYAELFLKDAPWDKYHLSFNSPLELFLHTSTDLQINLVDSQKLRDDDFLGAATLKLFHDSSATPLVSFLETHSFDFPLTRDGKKTGTVKGAYFLHSVYNYHPTQVSTGPKIIYPFKNLVLEGGGVRGVAYGGCLQVLDERGILNNIDRIAGTSAGSIAGLGLALGANSARIRRALEEIDFSSFTDGNVFTTHGLALHEGNVLSQAVKDLIVAFLTEKNVTKEKLNVENLQDVTFRHLKQLHDDPTYKSSFKLFYAIGTKVSLSPSDLAQMEPLDMICFNHETTPDLPIWEAVRISMSVPFFFKPIFLDGVPYVDGGVVYNYAINIFDEDGIANVETLGLRVDTPSEIAKFLDSNNLAARTATEEFFKKYRDSSPTDEVVKLIQDFTKKLSIYQTTRTDDGRSIYINTGSIKTTDFKIESEEKDGLIKYGNDWCLNFFRWWDDQYRKNPTPTGPIDAAGKLKTRR